MRKFFIGFSGVYLILVGIIMFALSFVSFFLLPQISNTQMARYNIFMAGTVQVVSGLLLIVTGWGIILKKNWARVSLLLMSIFSGIIGLFSSVTFFIMPLPQKVQVPKLIPIVFFVFFLVAVPIFFITFFNKKSIKVLFMPVSIPEKKNKRPFGITLIAMMSLISGLLGILAVFPPVFSNKFPLGPIMLSGKVLKVYILSMNFIQIYIGIGMLKLKKTAWKTAVFYYLLGVFIIILNVVTVTKGILSQYTPQLINSSFNMTLANFRIFSLIGLVPPAAILIYLFLKRNLFLKKALQ